MYNVCKFLHSSKFTYVQTKNQSVSKSELNRLKKKLGLRSVTSVLTLYVAVLSVQCRSVQCRSMQCRSVLSLCVTLVTL